MIVCGIDIGLDGGIGFLDAATGEVLFVSVLPITESTHGQKLVDVLLTRDWLCAHRPTLVVMERTHSFGHEARSACFSYGRSTGRLQSLLELEGLAYEEVTPPAWKAVILAGTKKDKAAAIGYAKRRWPGSLRRNHDGMADALCMAEFARRRLHPGDPS